MGFPFKSGGDSLIEYTVGIVSLFALIAIFLIKLYAVSRQGDAYPPIGVFLGLIAGWISWLLLFMSLSASIMAEDIIVTPDGETYTIEANEYGSYSLFLNFANIIVGLITIFSIIEVMFFFNSMTRIKQPMRGRRNARY